jgi:hypothetical protein
VAELPPLVVVQPDLGQRTLAHRVVDEIAMRLTAIGRRLGGLVAEITRRLAVVNVTVVGNSQHHWHPPRRVSDALFRLTVPDGKT